MPLISYFMYFKFQIKKITSKFFFFHFSKGESLALPNLHW
jgi:hypothetical protein